ncbi:glycosyltransferase family 39 protein [uncultured Acetobacteroides sp.]|uniref:glycosyltransferase family 39 protein n=1 Tax=uncultured Acetobacteroides sp. TaxID=1760811 RepID=UPI0029F4E5F4|nr:glycosyltransferase family 39 protein [uncultured Acetobacteroides sp.]
MISSKIKAFTSRYWILLLLVLVKFVLQFTLVNQVYELHRDEFLYLDQAKHLDFGFICVPPLTSLFSSIIYLLGGGLFWIRFVPALFGALTIVFTWLIVEAMGGSLWSRVLAACAILFSVLVRLNILFQPNAFDILAWTMAFYFLIKYVQIDKAKWIYGLSVVAAMGIYNKYTLVFLLFGLAVAILLTEQRRLLAKASVWKAIGLLVILLLPNILWQVAHHFPAVEHMKALKASQLDNNSSLNFLKEQAMYLSGSMALAVAGLIAFANFKPFRPYRFVGISIVAVITLYAFLKAKGYYAVGLYPVLLAFGSVYLERILSLKWNRIVTPLLAGCNLAVFILTADFIYPISTPLAISQNPAAFEKMGMLRWEDGKNHELPQDFADMVGWHEMADKSLKAYRMIPKGERRNTLVFCDNYGQTGALNYYNRGAMPAAYAFNADYIYWLPRLKAIKNVIKVGSKPSKDAAAMFREVKLVGVVDSRFAREKGTGIYLLTGANASFTPMFYAMADERINSLDIF